MDLMKTDDYDLANILHAKPGEIDIHKPFEQEIFLFETHIAGTSYIKKIDELKEQLEIDKKLTFFREPENQFDKKAIKIVLPDGTKIGYVPKNDNVVFSRLMDAGKLLFGKIEEVDELGTWLKIKINIFLQE